MDKWGWEDNIACAKVPWQEGTWCTPGLVERSARLVHKD